MRHLASDYASPPGGRRDGETLKTLLPYLWPAEFGLRFRVAAALACLLLAKVLGVYVPVIFRDAVDVLSPSSGGGDSGLAVPVGLILAYGAARVMSQGFGELRDALFARVAQRAIRTVALQVFRHLHALALRFHLDRQTGGLNRGIERGTKGIEFLLSFMLFNILPTFLEIGLVCGTLWTLYDWRFPLLTLGTIGVYAAFTFAVTDWRTRYLRDANQSDQEANTKAVDSLVNYETVKYFGNEEHEAKRFDSSLRRYEQAAVMVKSTVSMLNLGQGLIIALGATGMMLLAGYGVRDHALKIGDFVLVNTYLLQLYLQLNALGFVYREIKRSLIDMEAMFSLLRENREIEDNPGAPALRIKGGDLVFENVDFAYDPERPILKGVSFTVPAGKTIAIVGPSGAGKSTLSRLLFRFYDVTSGRILIDGQDIRGVTQQSLRAAIGIVPQDTVLFNDTVFYNIAYGRPSASQAEIEEAARLARIHDFVSSLPDGYGTKVGERGLKLSGGEKQRVAIARTILKAPAILLFDEATSALDTHTEREIQDSLREVSRERTTLVIAHRLSTVVDADEILVLEQGCVIERGRHDSLLAAEGRYAGMWRKQQETAHLVEELKNLSQD
ncbi:MAG TPA: ABC transporter ATP-binding protein/permease [Candidatus Sulfotelmatobacter sp.]|jgi:ATP-binding cassette subfamily B protein|nr:ABC transporter ATP-binding protein/permease [Candidatus Sulfotelmatobacter sp.]